MKPLNFESELRKLYVIGSTFRGNGPESQILIGERGRQIEALLSGMSVPSSFSIHALKLITQNEIASRLK